MATFADELLIAARLLVKREPKRRGRLPEARVRRAISTAYYALFHFLIEEAGKRIAGADNFLAVRRRVLSRTFTHTGLKKTFAKVRGQHVDTSLVDFLKAANMPAGDLATPVFARNMASVFLDAISKREDADYNRNQVLSEADADILIGRVHTVIEEWIAATSTVDRDFKHALFMIMLLKGQIRADA